MGSYYEAYGHYEDTLPEEVDELIKKVMKKVNDKKKLTKDEKIIYDEIVRREEILDKMFESGDNWEEEDVKLIKRLYTKGVALRLIPGATRAEHIADRPHQNKKLHGEDLKRRLYNDEDSIKKREERAAKPAFPSFRKSKAKPKSKKAKPAFRTGSSQGKDMIKNMNRITRTAINRARK